MLDATGRDINYLRVSLTDRCNLRCRYCMPAEGITPKPHGDILTYEELIRIIGLAVSLGITRVRLTGGEPLVRRDILAFVGALRQAVPGLTDLSMTTNAVALAPIAATLQANGLDRVNISLDTLRPDRFAALTGRDELAAVLRGIDSALAAGLAPVKLNAVVMRGTNDDEVADLARLTVERPLHVRFIELMPLGPSGEAGRDRFVSGAEMQDHIERELGTLAPLVADRAASARPTGNGPARYFRLPGAAGTVGFITPLSQHFCTSCNRLRLSADGRLEPCLAATAQYDLRRPLRTGASNEELLAVFRAAVTGKPREHHLDEDDEGWRQMSRIGG